MKSLINKNEPNKAKSKTTSPSDHDKARDFIHNHYKVELGSSYCEEELDSVIKEYGVYYLVCVIKKLRLKYP